MFCCIFLLSLMNRFNKTDLQFSLLRTDIFEHHVICEKNGCFLNTFYDWNRLCKTSLVYDKKISLKYAEQKLYLLFLYLYILQMLVDLYLQYYLSFIHTLISIGVIPRTCLNLNFVAHFNIS